MGKIHTALLAIKGEVGVIEKDGWNKEQKFEFRSIDSIYNRCHYVFEKHGVITVPRVLRTRRSKVPGKTGGFRFCTILEVEYTMTAEDGSTVVAVTCGEGMDNGDKATSKAMAMAHKYLFVQLLQLQTHEDPDEHAMDDRDARRPRTSDDNAHAERSRERLERATDPAPTPITKAKSAEPAPVPGPDDGGKRTRVGLGTRIMNMIPRDLAQDAAKNKAKSVLLWMVGRDDLSYLTAFEIDLGYVCCDVVTKCAGDSKEAKRWVNEVWQLPWFDKMTERDLAEAEKHMKAGGLDHEAASGAGPDEGIPF